MDSYTAFDLLFYLLLYAFIGWGIQVCCGAVKNRRFINQGFLNLPLNLPYGIAAALLLPTLDTLTHRTLLQYLMTLVIYALTMSLSDQFVRRVSRKAVAPVKRGKQDIFAAMIVALVYLLMYLVVHPVIFSLVSLIPGILERVLVITVGALVALDFASVLHTLRTNVPTKREKARKETTQRIADRITGIIWRRLQKAYPGIGAAEVPGPEKYIFAKGICFDKLVWVFLVSSFLGALIEMSFCWVTAGRWMNRSSVLYGSFSFVWGFGAVVLTVALQHVADRPDWQIFLVGFVIGGAYEYLCSVFTELVFGTVFWDYSDMPLNIGGRTNVLYCIFWGLLAVVWIKVLYPPMDKGIEKLPPLLGKVMTWVIVFFMVCDGLLTAAAMARYTIRQENPAAGNGIDTFLDTTYDDPWMENRWPNMIIPEDT